MVRLFRITVRIQDLLTIYRPWVNCFTLRLGRHRSLGGGLNSRSSSCIFVCKLKKICIFETMISMQYAFRWLQWIGNCQQLPISIYILFHYEHFGSLRTSWHKSSIFQALFQCRKAVFQQGALSIYIPLALSQLYIFSSCFWKQQVMSYFRLCKTWIGDLQ